MSDESEYQRLVTIIDDIENTAGTREVATIDISDTFNAAENITTKKYSDLVDFIDSMETGKSRSSKESFPKFNPKDLAAQPHLITSGVAQSQFTQSNAQIPFSQSQQPVQQIQAPGDATQKQKMNVAKELNSLASRLGSMKPLQKMSRPNIKDLVLPNLSVADQIAELERIIEGLKEHVFDTAHLDIVKQEVFGLQQAVNAMKKQKEKRPDKGQNLERSLWDLRDQRLNDTVLLLKGYGGN